MRGFIAAAVLLTVAASCTPTDLAMMTGDYGTAIDLMQGAGSVARAPDGATTFRWIIREDAYAGWIPDDQHEEQRLDTLATWIGQQDICQRGYDVGARSLLDGHLVYEGTCR